MELAIALGIGLWFLICGILSFIHVSKTFKSKDRKENK